MPEVGGLFLGEDIDPRSDTLFIDIVKLHVESGKSEIHPDVVEALLLPLQIQDNYALVRASQNLVASRIWATLSLEVKRIQYHNEVDPEPAFDLCELLRSYRSLVEFADNVRSGEPCVSWPQMTKVLNLLHKVLQVTLSMSLSEQFSCVPPYLAMNLVASVDNASSHGYSAETSIYTTELRDKVRIIVMDNGHGFDLSSLDHEYILGEECVDPRKERRDGIRTLVNNILSRNGTVLIRSGGGIGLFYCFNHQRAYSYSELKYDTFGTSLEIQIPLEHYYS